MRGNSSASFDKKSYAFETWDADDSDLDVALLGLPAEEDWVLQGPYSDKSLIRNHLVYSLSRDIGRYAARTRFVELELNGDYRGVYVLMEKIKRDDVRLDLPPGAVLLKRDWVEGGDAFIRTSACRDDLKVEWPDSAEGVVERLDAIEAELLAGDFSSIDLESFVDHMLIVELGRNVDGYVLSTWITLSEDGVLAMGPVWDYNGALGNASYFQAWKTEGWHYENPEFPGDNPRGFCWYEALLESPAFLQLRRERWQAHRAGALSDAAIEARIDEAVAVVQPAVDRNFERWPVLGEDIWPNDAGAEDRTTFEEEVAYLKTWVKLRTAWLDDAPDGGTGEPGGGEGDEDGGGEFGACGSFFECYEECSDYGCGNDCAEALLEGAALGATQTLLACMEAAGCGLLEESCIEASCETEYLRFEEACG